MFYPEAPGFYILRAVKKKLCNYKSRIYNIKRDMVFWVNLITIRDHGDPYNLLNCMKFRHGLNGNKK
jgi:hypothetical protein